jgi:hypothetical protein
MSQHTPGPEKIVETDTGVYGPNAADARLIAAAPRMLAALKVEPTDCLPNTRTHESCPSTASCQEAK